MIYLLALFLALFGVFAALFFFLWLEAESENDRLECRIKTLYLRILTPEQKGNPMPDPDSQLDAVSAFIDVEVGQIKTLTDELAAAIANAAGPNTVAPDVQAKLDALTAKIAEIQTPSA